MNQELQQSKLRLSVGLNLFENVNKSSIKKVQEQKRQPLCYLDIIPQDAKN